MNDRFEQLHQLPKNLYIEGAPIIILAGSLLKDKVSGNIVAQIKFQSVSEKPIKALKLDIMSMDVSGQELGDIIEYQYLDLDVRTGRDFGSNKAILIPNAVARSFRIIDITVIFGDGEKWFSDEQMKSLATAQSLENAMGDVRMEEQYRMATNRHALYKPMQDSDLWYCSCGLWNKSERCVKCSLRRDTAFKAFNVETLREALNARIAEEEERARIVKEQAEAKEMARKKKLKRTLLIATPIIIVVGIILVLVLTRVDRIKNQAREAIDEGKYLYALGILDEIEGESGVSSLQEEVQKFMSDEISKAIGDKECEEAVGLLEEYSSHLRDDVVNMHREQIMDVCPHQSTHIESAEATCENDGYSNKICDLCGYMDETRIEALGHSYNVEVTKEATCTEVGVEKAVCSICGDETKNDVQKKEHDYEEKVTKEPTYSTEGVKTSTCVNCGDIKESSVPKLTEVVLNQLIGSWIHEADNRCETRLYIYADGSVKMELYYSPDQIDYVYEGTIKYVGSNKYELYGTEYSVRRDEYYSWESYMEIDSFTGDSFRDISYGITDYYYVRID